MHESGKWKWSRSVVSNSLRPHGLQPTRLLLPWDFPGKSTGVGCHHLGVHKTQFETCCYYKQSVPLAQDATFHFHLQPSLWPSLTVDISSDWCLPFHLFLFGSQSSLLHSELPEDKSFVLFLRVKQALASTRLPFLQPLFWLGQHYSSQSLFWGKPLLLQPSTTIPLSFGDTNHVILVTVTCSTMGRTTWSERAPFS